MKDNELRGWPRVPPHVIASSYDDDTRRLFEESYVSTLRSRQVTATWAGFALAVFLGLLIHAVTGGE